MGQQLQFFHKVAKGAQLRNQAERVVVIEQLSPVHPTPRVTTMFRAVSFICVKNLPSGVPAQIAMMPILILESPLMYGSFGQQTQIHPREHQYRSLHHQHPQPQTASLLPSLLASPRDAHPISLDQTLLPRACLEANTTPIQLLPTPIANSQHAARHHVPHPITPPARTFTQTWFAHHSTHFPRERTTVKRCWFWFEFPNGGRS